ncbi:MAG: 2-hydroxyacyl-CoA dehydratase family protein [Clostridia bacterium]
MAETKNTTKVKGLGDLFNGKIATTRREWKGFKDTMYDFGRWLKCWKLIIIGLTFKAPIQTVKSLFRYRWMASYLSTPAFVDRHTLGLKGYELRYAHNQFFTVLEHSVNMLATMLKADKHLNGNSKKAAALRKKIVIFDEMMPCQIGGFFPNLIFIPIQMIPVFEAGEVDQSANLPYIDAIENFGLPADSCPLPAAESGCAALDDYPLCGDYFIGSSMPCDGSVSATVFMDRYFKLPSYQIAPPVRFNEPEIQAYAVKNIQGCIKWLEEQTGEKCDWDHYFEVAKRYNTETQYMLDKWEINRTPYPQVCGASLALHREYAFQVAGNLDPKFVKNDIKVHDLMMKGYEQDKKLDNQAKYRAIVWGCPAHYYSNFTFWAQNCWGIKTLVDMECMLSHHFFNTEDKYKSLVDLATAYERMTMRSHTNGGFVNVLDECWKMCEYFNCNIVIMYYHVSCKSMNGLQGLFEEQARERGIHLIWVEHDLCDRRTVSRKSMRGKVNNYMETVFKAKPLDPTLVEYNDDLTW